MFHGNGSSGARDSGQLGCGFKTSFGLYFSDCPVGSLIQINLTALIELLHMRGLNILEHPSSIIYIHIVHPVVLLLEIRPFVENLLHFFESQKSLRIWPDLEDILNLLLKNV